MSPSPAPGLAVKISPDGGQSPRWSAHTKELLYWHEGTIRSVSYAAAHTFVPGHPRRWAPQDGVVGFDFDLHPDGKLAAVGLVDVDAGLKLADSRDGLVFWSGFVDYLQKNVVTRK